MVDAGLFDGGAVLGASMIVTAITVAVGFEGLTDRHRQRSAWVLTAIFREVTTQGSTWTEGFRACKSDEERTASLGHFSEFARWVECWTRWGENENRANRHLQVFAVTLGLLGGLTFGLTGVIAARDILPTWAVLLSAVALAYAIIFDIVPCALNLRILLRLRTEIFRRATLVDQGRAPFLAEELIAKPPQ